MFRLLKQLFIALLSFKGSLATKCMSLNSESCTARPTLIDLNTVELNYYPFMISLDKSNEVVMLLMTSLKKHVFPVKQDVNVKVLNMITRTNEAKTLVKHISCECKCKFNLTTCNVIQIKNGMMINVNVSVKSIVCAARL